MSLWRRIFPFAAAAALLLLIMASASSSAAADRTKLLQALENAANKSEEASGEKNPLNRLFNEKMKERGWLHHAIGGTKMRASDDIKSIAAAIYHQLDDEKNKPFPRYRFAAALAKDPNTMRTWIASPPTSKSLSDIKEHLCRLGTPPCSSSSSSNNNSSIALATTIDRPPLSNATTIDNGNKSPATTSAASNRLPPIDTTISTPERPAIVTLENDNPTDEENAQPKRTFAEFMSSPVKAVVNGIKSLSPQIKSPLPKRRRDKTPSKDATDSPALSVGSPKVIDASSSGGGIELELMDDEPPTATATAATPTKQSPARSLFTAFNGDATPTSTSSPADMDDIDGDDGDEGPRRALRFSDLPAAKQKKEKPLLYLSASYQDGSGVFVSIEEIGCSDPTYKEIQSKAAFHIENNKLRIGPAPKSSSEADHATTDSEKRSYSIGNAFTAIGKGKGRRTVSHPASHSLVVNRDKNRGDKAMEFANNVKKDQFERHRFESDEVKRSLCATAIAIGIGVSLENIEQISAISRAIVLHDLKKCGLEEAVGLNKGDLDCGRAAYSNPGKTTFDRCAYDLLAGELLCHVLEMLGGEVRAYGAAFDHGHRSGIHHFVKVISYYSFREDKVKWFCLDNNACGGTAEECARAINNSLSKLVGVQESIELAFVTADSGGGGSCHNVHPELIRSRVMPKDSKRAPCMLHVWQRCYANAMIAVFGEGGLGMRTLLQLLHSCNDLRQAVGKDLFREYWRQGLEYIFEDDDVRLFFIDQCEDAFAEFSEEVEAGNLPDSTEVDKFKCPDDIQRAVLTRWCYVDQAAKHVDENWVGWLAIAHTVKHHYKSGSKAWKIACGLISLMEERTETPDEAVSTEDPQQFNYGHFGSGGDGSRGDGDGADEVDGDGADEDVAVDIAIAVGEAIDATQDLQDNQGHKSVPPTFYVHLQFIRILSDSLFLPFYEWLKKTDPIAGEHGYLSAHMAFFCYYSRKSACELRDDFVERGPLSAKYWALVDRMPRLGDVKLAGREHAELAPKIFFENFLATSDNHFPHWTSKGMLHYMIGGSPELAKQFCRWVFPPESGPDAIQYVEVSNDRGDPDTICVVPDSFFPDEDIEPTHLGKPFYRVSDSPATINVRSFMKSVTDQVMPSDVATEAFVLVHRDEIEEIASSDKIVDIWVDDDYIFLRDDVKTYITPHAHHQQTVERLVHDTSLAATQGSGQRKRSVIVALRTCIVMPLTKALVAKRNATRSADEKKINRIQGSKKLEALIQEAVERAENVEKLKKSHPKLFKEIRAKITEADQLHTAQEDEDAASRIKGVLQTKWNKYFSSGHKKNQVEGASGVLVTAPMGGTMKISELTMGKSKEAKKRAMNALHAEFAARECNKEEYESLQWKAMKKLLQIKELRRLREDKNISKFESADDVKEFVPFSDEMQNWLVEIRAADNAAD